MHYRHRKVGSLPGGLQHMDDATAALPTRSKERTAADLMPDGGKQAVQLSVFESVSGHWQQSDEAGVHQQALGNLPAGTHAHHVMQEHLREGAAGKGSCLQAQTCKLSAIYS